MGNNVERSGIGKGAEILSRASLEWPGIKRLIYPIGGQTT